MVIALLSFFVSLPKQEEIGMALINFSRKEIAFKLVYYGPALSGKTTNLEQIHQAIAEEVQDRHETHKSYAVCDKDRPA